ncbi:MAG: fumarylacetoacetate hydrolase family protein [Acidobacteriota bacterium]
MKLVNYASSDGAKRLGWMRAEGLVDVAQACELMGELPYGETEILRILETGGAIDRLRVLSETFSDLQAKHEDRAESAQVRVEGLRWFAPIAHPEKIVCVGLNYRDHAEEQNVQPPAEPLLFAKFPTTVIGHREDVLKPSQTNQLDYEVELGVVIGKLCSRVGEAGALDYVGGYTIVNDISARDFQSRDKQWLRAKSSDTFAPMGPCLVTADEIKDPHVLTVRMTVNGEERQLSNTRNLIFNVPFLVSFISQFITLKPGDVISTGTPGGVGVFRKPPIFLSDGDKMRAEVEGIGELENRVRYLS